MEKQYDAELHDWIGMIGSFRGRVYNDNKGQFADGELIITTPMVSIEDGILQTMNTRYLLVGV